MASAQAENVGEDQFLLVVQDQDLADQLQGELAEEQPSLEIDLSMHTDRVGEIHFRNATDVQKYCVTVHDLPTLVETFKSHNHVDLVKSADVGQVLLIHPSPEGHEGPEAVGGVVQLMLGMVEQNQVPQEWGRGLTPPMAGGSNVFRYRPKASPKLVTEVEKQLLELMNGQAPDGWVIEDVAEVYVVDDAGKGAWMPVSQAPASVLKAGKSAAV